VRSACDPVTWLEIAPISSGGAPESLPHTWPILVASESDCANPEQAFEQHFDLVWRTVRRLGVPAGHVDDAVQDVFVVVHRRWNDFRNQSSRRTWIYGIAIRVASEHLRRARREQQRTSQTDPDFVSSESLADRSYQEREAGRVLHEILNRMGEPERQMLVLVDLEERSVVEAAEALGVNVNTAYSRLRRARIHFEKALKAVRPPRSDGA